MATFFAGQPVYKTMVPHDAAKGKKRARDHDKELRQVSRRGRLAAG